MVTSPADTNYNCIAWTAGDSDKWWWPSDDAYWPAGAPQDDGIQSFVDAFRTLGYEVCDDGTLEPGYLKAAIYAIDGRVKHMARQLPTGFWTSKLGSLEDIEHELEGVEGMAYGTAVAFLRKKAE